jgi:uncharacterized protein YutE (UPF0331/DUF86 family)
MISLAPRQITVAAERENVLRTVKLTEDLLSKNSLSEYEVIALGKLLQDIYTGIERVLRSQLESQNVKIDKTQGWHKEILLAAKKHSLISETQSKCFRDLLLFRHMEIHGYGYMLDKQRLLELARPVPAVCREFLENIKQ